MHKLAICVPTYNRAEIVSEMLLRCSKIYDQLGADIYFFDSSEDDKTQKIVSSYAVSFENIFYRKISPEVHSNVKVLHIYREFSNAEKYEYLWICQDHIQLTEEGTRLITKKCEESFDICILNYRDVENIGEKIYTDINELFYDCAWHMTSYMATMIHLTFLKDTEWEYIFEQYTVPQRINHSHVALFFEQLSRRTTIRAIHVPVSPRHIRVSSYREEAYWSRDIFLVWCEYWPNMIRKLPSCYRDKNKVIRKQGVNSGILSWDKFAEYRAKELYDIGVYKRYCMEWKNLAKIPRFFLWLLAYVPPDWAELFSLHGWSRRNLKRRILNFCNTKTTVYIYGSGYIAQKTSDLLNELQVQYQGYIVSDLSNEKKCFNGREVISCDDFFQKGIKGGIILAMKAENADQVIKNKPELKSYQLFLMYPYQDIWG